MMKPIDSVYLICVLSDTRSFDQEDTIKAGRIILGRSETFQKIGHRAGELFDVLRQGLRLWDGASSQEE